MDSEILNTLKSAKPDDPKDVFGRFADAIHVFEGLRQFHVYVKNKHLKDMPSFIGKNSTRTLNQAIIDFRQAASGSYEGLTKICMEDNSKPVLEALEDFKKEYSKEIEVVVRPFI